MSTYNIRGMIMRISRIDSSFSTDFNAKWHTKKPLPIKNPKNHNCAKGFGASIGTFGVVTTAGSAAIFYDKPAIPFLVVMATLVGSVLGSFGYQKGKELDEIVEEGKKEEEEFKRIHHLSDKN